MINNQKAYLAQERLFLIDKFGPLLFFFDPADHADYRWKIMGEVCRFSVSGIALIYIVVFYQARKYYLSFTHQNNKGIPYRFYRIAWVYLFLILCLEVVLLVQHAF
ncbi:hypothetical protein I3679_018190 [Proteus mirabilis]|uniref:Uncharacterized protein n=1 Tax=Proteus mirabilis TaxID=584 RepID=A0ABD5LYU3_PROMI